MSDETKSIVRGQLVQVVQSIEAPWPTNVKLTLGGAMNERRTILLVEDNLGDAQLISTYLEDVDAGDELELIHVTRLPDARRRIEERSFDAVLLDLGLPDSQGLETLAQLKRWAPRLPVVVLTGLADDQLGLRTVRAGAQDYLAKGQIDGQSLRRSLHHAIERSRAEETLRDYERILATSPYLMAIVNRDYTYRAVNEAYVRRYRRSRDEIVGRTVADLVGEEAFRERIQAWLDRALAGEELHYRDWFRYPELGRRYLEVSYCPLREDDGAVSGVVAHIRDRTQQEETEEVLRSKEGELRRTRRMEAIGRLAGGVAHDFHNVLTVVLGYSDLLASRLEADDALQGHVAKIKGAGKRALNLTRQLLAFSSKQVMQPQVVDLNGLVSGLSSLLPGLLGEHVELATRLDPKLGPIEVDPTQLEQVVMNLAVNARDAMPQGGRLTIETANVELDEATAERQPGIAPGAFVRITVRDSGVGMDEATRAQIFEPFFTTKRRGEGTGLGLATVYGIVHQSGGFLKVESALGAGTAFQVFLPQAGDWDASATEDTPTRSFWSHHKSQGRETVLVVEDEDDVRGLVEETLREAGYQILTAGDGVEALEIGRTHTGPIDLLLTDVRMPRMGGAELAREFALLRSGTRTLFMSGYPDEDLARDGQLDPSVAFLAKPFRPNAALEKIRQVLNEA